MSSNLVIAAIPDENDRVWKISSEKVPHMTLLFLGDSEKVANLDQIMLFVEHAASTSLKRFYLPVDRRGELGEDKADVLFFKKDRYDFNAVRDFRHLLLQDNNIKTAYDSSTQFEAPEAVGLSGQPWIPHLTLGYPTSPAKSENDDWGSIYSVDFNKIAVWTGNFEGPEFLLKDYWEEFDEMAIPMDVAMSDLQHAGVKGMRWGVRKTPDEADKQWQKKMLGSKISRKGVVIDPTPKIDKDVLKTSKKELKATTKEINNKPEYKAAKKAGTLKDENHPTTKKYDKEQFDAFSKVMTKNLASHPKVLSPSGNTKLAFRRTKDTWWIGTEEVKHADEVLFTVRPIRDEDGAIIDFEFVEDIMAQSSVDLGSEFILEHFGVKGMKWGRRAAAGAKATSTFVRDVQFETRTARGLEGQASKATNMVASASRKPFRKEDLPAVKARHGDYAKMTKRATKPFSKEAKAYRKDARETYVKRLETTANSMKNASGTREYTVRERGIDLPAQGGNLPKSKYFWEVSARDVKHAASNVDVRLELVMEDGYITDLNPVPVEDSLAQSAFDVGEDFVLEHFGVKGMRWGQRKSPPEAVATSARSIVPHGTKRKTKVKVEGGENQPAHEDAVKVAEARTKLSKSGTAALSNQELRDVANRLQLENQVAVLTSSRGKKFVTRNLEIEGERAVKKGVKRAAPHVVKKAGKTAATTAVTLALL